MKTNETYVWVPRTFDEILERIEEKREIFLNFEPEVLIEYLDDSHFAQLKDIDPNENYSFEYIEPSDQASILSSMEDYMEEIGWPKVLDHRGISAGRTVEKMRAWLWLLRDEEMVALTEDESMYPQYGAPILFSICQEYGFPIPEDPEIQNMIQGLPCVSGCMEGCGR